MRPTRVRICLLVLCLTLGSASAVLSQTDPPADIVIRGERDNGGFGYAATLAGDVNGDTHPDILIAAPGYDDVEQGQGRAYLFYGPVQGNLHIDQADVTITGEALVDGFGNSVAGAGDVNDDGFDDVLIGARSNDTPGIQAGRAYLFYGPLSGDLDALDADCIISGEAFDEVGWSLTGAGDLDQDGFDDILVGAWMADLSGKAFVFYGPLSGERSVTSAEATITAAIPNELLGESVASADLSNDGIPDLIIGAPRPPLNGNDTGRAYVFFGPVMGNFLSSQADVILTGEQLNDEFGTAVAGAGDVNGDGAEDLLVGAHQLFRDGNGKAYIFYGPMTSGVIPAAGADAVLLGEPPITEEENLFGETVASAGDANGDGFDDVLVAASNNYEGGTRAGRAYLFHGPLAGAIEAGSADLIVTGSEFNYLGTSLAPLGDLGGDGADDFLAGAPGFFDTGVLEYAAIFFGASAADVEDEAFENDLVLHQNWPNPAGPSTKIAFDLPRSAMVRLRVFDSAGRELDTLVKGERPAGRTEVLWRPEGRPAGIFYYRLEADGITRSRKLIVR